MHLLYIDESGAVGDSQQPYFVLAGVAIFERQTHWIEQRLNNIATRFNPANPHDIELHGSPMRSGRDGWKGFPVADRKKAIEDALREGVVNNYPQSARIFAAVVKKDLLPGSDPVEHAFEQIVNRFDLFLKRLYSKNHDPQRGIMIFDKSTTERRIQTLARDFKYNGHTWGRTKNYAEVPVFLDSKASRLIQLADLVAFAINRHYVSNDDSLFKIISPCFDSEGGVTHGLYERI